MFVYMKVSKDEYELPLAVADSVVELAEILGVKKNAIYDSMSHSKKGLHKTQYIKVELEDDDV